MGIFKCILETSFYILNVINSLIGLFVTGLGLYILFAKWDSVSYSGYLFSSGILVILFGVALVCISIIGHIAYVNRNRHFGKSVWNGTRIVLFYQCLVVLQLGYKVYCLVYLQTQFFVPIRDNNNNNNNNDNLQPFGFVENYIASKFNHVFFSAARSCIVDYLPFWIWINNNCPVDINQSACQACYSYSITMCQASDQTCFSEDSNNNACPYTICREGFSTFINTNFYMPFMIALLSVIVIDILTLLLYMQICCCDGGLKKRRKVNSVAVAPLTNYNNYNNNNYNNNNRDVEMISIDDQKQQNNETNVLLLSSSYLESKKKKRGNNIINNNNNNNNNNNSGNKESEIRQQQQDNAYQEQQQQQQTYSWNNEKPLLFVSSVSKVHQDFLF